MAKFDFFDDELTDSSFEKFDYIECRDIDILVEELQKYIRSENLIQDIIEAYRFAEEKHREQKRKNGDPFIIHPLSAAYYLAQWRMGPKTIIAGLLHDVVEDTPVTYIEIENLFGEEVANMVEAVTKASYFTVENRQQMKAVYLRKLFMSMVKDVRVIIIKLADRMHNMLTLKYMRPDKQKIIAQETLDIYASIAERIGMRTVKNLLEDYSFKYLDPEEYAYVAGLVEESRDERETRLNEIIENIQESVKFNHFLLDVKIFGRSKAIYSIYRKMVYFGKNFNDINDLLAIRIICNTADECYSILGWIHGMYIPLTGKFKDYIATPKNNLYQSLHTIVSSKNGTIFEVQIRTSEMDEIAERGIAAHWKYKEGIETNGSQLQKDIEQRIDIFSQLTNLEKLRGESGDDTADESSIVDAALSNDGDITINSLLGESATETAPAPEKKEAGSLLSSDDIKTELNNPSLYIMTPDSSIVIVPFRSTVLDFAYKIHSDIGNKVIGAKVNGVFASINTALNSGDLVEVLTAEDAHPTKKWLKYAKTPLAIKEIKKYLQQQETMEVKNNELSMSKQIRNVKKEIDQYIMDHNLKWNLNSVEEMEKKVRILDYQSIDEFLKAVVEGAFTINEAVDLVYVNKTDISKTSENISDLRARRFYSADGRKDVIVNNMSSADYSFAKCCYPLPKEDITAVVEKNNLVIHRKECSVILNAKNKDFIDVKWNAKPEARRYLYNSKLRITGEQSSNIVYRVLGVFASLNVQIDQIKAAAKDDDITFKCSIMAMPSDLMQLKQLISAIQTLPGITRVKRIVTPSGYEDVAEMDEND
jgi:guanosine-3',5'-bis(diphosphate) 3'-pyrophosphohydrolase